jgi:type I restriction enzyme S subunit
MSWREIVLGSAIHVKHGFAFKGELFADHGEYIVLTPGNFNEDGGFRIRPEKDRAYTGDIPEAFILRENDLIVAMTEQGAGLLGSAALVPQADRYLHNQRLGLVDQVDKSLLDKRFLYLLFNTHSVRAQISGSASGTKVRHTAPERIYRVQVRIPDINTQTSIAETVLAYDDLIENNRRRIALLEESARLLYHEWFVRLRFPGYEHTKFIDNTPIKWSIHNVSDLIKRVAAGKLFSQKTALLKGSVPILDQGRSGIIGFHNEEPSVYASINNPVIVFANHTCFQRIIFYPFSAIQNMLPFIPSEEFSMNIVWLHYATLDIVKTNAYKGHWPELISKEVLVPPPELADLFAGYIKPNLEMVYSLNLQNQKLRAARDLLLPRLMSGKIAV